MIVILFGVSGAGKTTIGELLAKELGWEFYDADDFHSPDKIDKMRRRIPLTDEDRQTWLTTLRRVIERAFDENKDAVLACSALKKKYRDYLRVNAAVRFVYLRGDNALVADQLKQRRDHFINPALLQSQFADLEEPQPAEAGVVIEIGRNPGELVAEIRNKLALSGAAKR